MDSGALSLSRLKLTIGPRRLWVTAAVLEWPLHDVLLGRECEDLTEFLEEALIKTETRDQATVTMQQARAEEIEDGRDASADDACETDHFTFSGELGSDRMTEPKLSQATENETTEVPGWHSVSEKSKNLKTHHSCT